MYFRLSFCLFSECGSYRWILKRELSSGSRTIVFIGLNPSKANSFNNDRTLVRIINFCSRWRYKNIYIINLFGLISKSPNELTKNKDPVGKKNNIITLKKKSKCPTCKKVSKEPFIPFCSKKCANLDLMKWLTDEHGLQIKSD